MAHMQHLQTLDFQWKESGGLASERNDGLRRYLIDYISSKLGSDPALVAKCTPKYAPWARRLVMDNGWYDALLRDNVHLVTDRIARITPTGIVTENGIEHSFDVLILGSGFSVSKYLWPTVYRGRNGATLDKLWSKDGPRAYLGMTMPGFPNLFIFYGPNGQPRSGGYHSWAEIWTRYAVRSIVHLLERGEDSMECKQEVFDEYNTRMDQEHKKLIWDRVWADIT
jgi:4-hydroxyacetophenone monooxygenase